MSGAEKCVRVCLFTQTAPQPPFSLTLVLSTPALRSSRLSKCSSCTTSQLTADGANEVATCLPGTHWCPTNMGQAHPEPWPHPAAGEVLVPSWALEGLAILSRNKVTSMVRTGRGARNTPRVLRYANKMPSPKTPK